MHLRKKNTNTNANTTSCQYIKQTPNANQNTTWLDSTFCYSPFKLTESQLFIFGSNLWECSKRECTLNFANVILQDRFW